MQSCRTIGIDLGIATAHTAVIVDAQGTVVSKRQARPYLELLEALERAALDGAGEGERPAIVVEPTGVAWLPVAVFFIRRGHVVYRVSSSKASDLRKFFERHSKTNQIDALSLARMPLVDPGSLVPLELPEDAAASLNRRVRVCQRLSHEIGRHKTRTRELARQLMPAIDHAMDTKCRGDDLVVLERYGDPRRLARISPERLATFIRSKERVPAAYAMRKATCWVEVARAAAELYGDDPAVPFEDLAEEIGTEAAIIRTLERELDRHEAAREEAYLKVDSAQLARSLPGVGVSGGPLLVASMGRPGRFPTRRASAVTSRNLTAWCW